MVLNELHVFAFQIKDIGLVLVSTMPCL